MTLIQIYNPEIPAYAEIHYTINKIMIRVSAIRNVELAIEHVSDNKYRLTAYITDYHEQKNEYKTVKTTIIITGEKPRRAYTKITQYINNKQCGAKT